MTIASPFAPVLDEYNSLLPDVLGQQYLLPSSASYYLVFTGEMSRIWHTKQWLWPYFWALAQFDIVFPESGENVPAQVIIHSGQDSEGRPFQEWQRIYYFPAKTRYSNARLIFDRQQGLPVELFRPFGNIRVAWDMQFRPPHQLFITTTEYTLQLGRLRWKLPDVLRGQVEVMETADPVHANQIHIQFALSYPRLGTVFGYEGTFACEKRPYRQPPMTVYNIPYGQQSAAQNSA